MEYFLLIYKLMKSEGKVEAFFKDKIDWKPFNFIQYVLTSYEDNDAEFDYRLSVCIMDDFEKEHNRHYIQLVYNTYSNWSAELKPEYNESDYKYKVRIYNKNGIVYGIWVHRIPENIRKEIYTKLQTKLDIVQDDGVNVIFKAK